MEQHNTRTRNRGFASMDTHRQREIARKGGRAAHEKGKAHEFTPDEARAAGRKGGEKVSMNRKHMAEIGRRGGRSSAQRRRPDSGPETMPSPGEVTESERKQEFSGQNAAPPRDQAGETHHNYLSR
jgi:general stress protein YciG